MHKKPLKTVFLISLTDETSNRLFRKDLKGLVCCKQDIRQGIVNHVEQTKKSKREKSLNRLADFMY